jgi:Ca2+-binding RTX toxin-like protein
LHSQIGGFDTYYGGDGNDLLAGDNNQSDTFYGGNGNDVLLGDNYENNYGGFLVDATTGSGANIIYGGEGSDIMYGWAGNDVLYGGGGNDGGGITQFIPFPDNYNFVGPNSALSYNGEIYAAGLYGGEGNDYLDGGQGSDYLDGGDGDDVLLGGQGSDTIIAGAGNDVIYDISGADSINQGRDMVFGGFGNDRIYGMYGAGDGGMFAVGGAGDDTIIAGAGADILYGNDGSDILWGAGGNDVLFGAYQGARNNIGVIGNDNLIGGLGSDEFYGGSNADYFNLYFEVNAGDTDLINGLQVGTDYVVLPKWTQNEVRYFEYDSPTIFGYYAAYGLIEGSNGTHYVFGAAFLNVAQLQASVYFY